MILGRLSGAFLLNCELFALTLLFALPLLPGNSTLTVQQPVESESYIRMTIEAIAASGIEVQESNAFSWRIPGHQQYKSYSCHLNGDYSQAAVLCCAGALGHDITVTHLSPVTTQGDRAILRHLMALGAKPGPGLRGQLEALLEAVITGQLPNERNALLAAVKIELDP